MRPRVCVAMYRGGGVGEKVEEQGLLALWHLAEHTSRSPVAMMAASARRASSFAGAAPTCGQRRIKGGVGSRQDEERGCCARACGLTSRSMRSILRSILSPP